MMVLLLVVSLGGSDGDAAIVLELDDLLGREVVKEGVGFIEVLVGGLGGPQLPLQLLDPLKPLSECSVLIGVDSLFLLVGFFREPAGSVCLEELGRGSLRATRKLR